ncbi:MAG TPA: DUF4311 domain-containing protein [Firmicutes bacterium]|nr:DUF4311 domain-containing protein [Candidatus Fermentithermobacillaceae bacterium]
MLSLVVKSVIVGALAGWAVTVGAVRMFHAPEIQSMGAFRTLGELNACKGDPVSHFMFGLGFLFNSAASVVGAGALTQDVLHRIVPNWASALVLLKTKDTSEPMNNTRLMGMAGAVVGAVVVTLLNTISSAVPSSMAVVASKVLGQASNWLINPIMPIIFWLAALDAGVQSGVAATLLGGLAQMIMGNAVPGCVLGIIIGKNVEENGWNKSVKILLTIVVILFASIAYFRGFHVKFFKAFAL